ncbi:MAG TPA: hypothetical protein VMG10_27295 [Gemmataceae bacterium]|nr:hypothetical protein [Gemmataceae bacterium]
MRLYPTIDPILNEFVNGPPGERPVGNVLLGPRDKIDPKTVTRLDARLKEIRRQLEVYFIICVALIVVLFLTQLHIVLFHLDQPYLVTGAVTFCGMTTSGLIFYLAGLWRERDRTGTIIALALALDPTELRGVLHVLLKNYDPTARPHGKRTKNV